VLCCFEDQLLLLVNSEKRIEFPLSWNQLYKFSYQLCEVVGHLHSAKLIHNSIGLKNLFMGADGNLRLSGFQLTTSEGMLSTDYVFDFALPESCAPERLSRLTLTYQTDIFSIGMSMFELANQGPAFPGQKKEEIESQLRMGKYPPCDPSWPEEFRSIVDACRTIVPSERPTIETMMKKLSKLFDQN